MKIVSFLENNENLEELLQSKCEDIILSTRELGRLGKLDFLELELLASKLKQHGKNPILNWDILMTEKVMTEKVRLIKSLDLSLFSAVRIQDPGALHYFSEHISKLPIQLVLEHGNHNLKSIEGWTKLGGDSLERLILSPQIPLKLWPSFISLAKKLNVELELLVLGPLMLFYTPRSLVSPFYEKDKEVDNFIELTGASEETPHKGFPIIENLHGTFMLNPKDLCLIEHIEELRDMGLSAIRFDLRFNRPFSIINKLMDTSLSVQNIRNLIKELYPNPTIKGLFQNNRSDVLFKKLKKQPTSKRGLSFLGQVMDVEKKSHLAILLKNPHLKLKKGDRIEFRTPEGIIKEVDVREIRSSQGHFEDEMTAGSLAILPHVSGIIPKTSVYLL